MPAEAEGSPVALYSKGNEAFVSEDYNRAIELYSDALALSAGMAECLVARAHAFIKTNQFQLAKKDADRAIDIYRAADEGGAPLSKAFLRSGVASFHMGQYKEAKNSFTQAQKLGDDTGLKQWLFWCEEKIAKFGDIHPGQPGPSPAAATKTAPAAAPAFPAVSSGVTETVMASTEETVKVDDTHNSAGASDTKAQPEQQQQPDLMPVPKIKHDWYQTETQVVVEVRIKNMKSEDVQVDIQDTSLSVTAKLPIGSDYSLELDLAHPIVPAQSGYRVLSTKIEIKLRKGEGIRWSNLEGDGSAPIPGIPPPAAAGSVKGPYSSGKDWSKIEQNLSKEAEDKAEGEAALNEMFQKIYADASDEVKKAMNKSFQESGGTVLSTNWSEVGKEKVTVKPPDGMEWRKWE